MTWFLAPRLGLADIVALATVTGVFLQHGLLPACAAAGGLGVLLSVARLASGLK